MGVLKQNYDNGITLTCTFKSPDNFGDTHCCLKLARCVTRGYWIHGSISNISRSLYISHAHLSPHIILFANNLISFCKVTENSFTDTQYASFLFWKKQNDMRYDWTERTRRQSSGTILDMGATPFSFCRLLGKNCGSLFRWVLLFDTIIPAPRIPRWRHSNFTTSSEMGLLNILFTSNW